MDCHGQFNGEEINLKSSSVRPNEIRVSLRFTGSDKNNLEYLSYKYNLSSNELIRKLIFDKSFEEVNNKNWEDREKNIISHLRKCPHSRKKVREKPVIVKKPCNFNNEQITLFKEKMKMLQKLQKTKSELMECCKETKF